jgi:hypothetical protein
MILASSRGGQDELQMSDDRRDALLHDWHRALERARACEEA